MLKIIVLITIFKKKNLNYISWTYRLKSEYSKNLYIKKIFWLVLNRSNRFTMISSIQRKRVDLFLLVLSNSHKSMNWIVWFIFMSKNTNQRFWLFDSLFFSFWNKIVTLFFFQHFSFSKNFICHVQYSLLNFNIVWTCILVCRKKVLLS